MAFRDFVTGSRTFLPASRALSVFEVALGATIVVAHNVWRVLPNEVPILVVLGLVSFRLRNGGLADMGFRRPSSWGRVVALAAGAAAVRILLGDLVVDPLTARWWPPATAPSIANEIHGDARTALLVLGLVWTFAAFGEEIAYRGYLLNRAAHVGRLSPAAHGLSLVLTAALFGAGHFYKGPAGMIDSGVAGLVLGGVYLLAGRNLWASILAHGFIDTYGVAALYVGWDA